MGAEASGLSSSAYLHNTEVEAELEERAEERAAPARLHAQLKRERDLGEGDENSHPCVLTTVYYCTGKSETSA